MTSGTIASASWSANPRAWLNPSPKRNRTSASRSSVTSPIRRAVCQASSADSVSPSMSVVTGTARTELTRSSSPQPDGRCQARCGKLTAMVETMTREQVMAHRIAAQGLHRDRPGAIAALASLGIQDSGPTARLVLAARTDDEPTSTRPPTA